MKTAFWRGKRVFLTGHTGFKGAWLSLWLHRLGAQVTGFSLDPPSSPSLYESAGVGNLVRSSRGDVRDRAALTADIRKARPEVLFHLAAQSLVRRSYTEPAETFDTNLMGTVNVLEAARNAGGVAAAIMVTSDKCYQNLEDGQARVESDPLGGDDPYSASKGCAELASAAYRASFPKAFTIATVRAGNVVGGGDWAEDRLLPDIVRAYMAGQPLSLRMPGAVRPWQHVLDVLGGYLELAERTAIAGGDAYGGPWNFGPPAEGARSVAWIAERAADFLGMPPPRITGADDAKREKVTLMLDASRAGARLGWKPLLETGTAVDWTLDWYRRSLAGKSAAELCESQIDAWTGLKVAA